MLFSPKKIEKPSSNYYFLYNIAEFKPLNFKELKFEFSALVLVNPQISLDTFTRQTDQLKELITDTQEAQCSSPGKTFDRVVESHLSSPIPGMARAL